MFLEIDIHAIWGLASHDSDEDGADLGWTPKGYSLLKFTQVYILHYSYHYNSLHIIDRKSSIIIIITITSQWLIAWYLTPALKRWPPGAQVDGKRWPEDALVAPSSMVQPSRDDVMELCKKNRGEPKSIDFTMGHLDRTMVGCWVSIVWIHPVDLQLLDHAVVLAWQGPRRAEASVNRRRGVVPSTISYSISAAPQHA